MCKVRSRWGASVDTYGVDFCAEPGGGLYTYEDSVHYVDVGRDSNREIEDRGRTGHGDSDVDRREGGWELTAAMSFLKLSRVWVSVRQQQHRPPCQKQQPRLIYTFNPEARASNLWKRPWSAQTHTCSLLPPCRSECLCSQHKSCRCSPGRRTGRRL